MSKRIIPFGEWLPDVADLNNSGATVVKNVLSSGNQYKPMTDIQANSDALTANCQGAISVFDNTNAVHTFAGDATKLYKLSTDGSAFSDVSQAGGYSTDTDANWVFVQYGQQIIASNFTDNTQEYTIGSSSLFADLDATAPKAKVLEVVNNFVVAGYTNDSVDGTVPNRVRWSAIDNPSSWTVSATTQADYQNLENGGGAVNGIVGTQNEGIIIQDRAISRMEYVGTPTIFNITTVEYGRGSRIPKSIISDGQLVFYIGDDGFYLFDGSRSIPIGHAKIDNWWLADVDSNNYHRITAAIDPLNKIVCWSYMSNDASTDPDKLIIYNWADNRWTLAEVTCQYLCQALSHGVTLEQLSALYPDLDTLVPFSLDSRVWQGGRSLLAGFTSDNKLGYFDGARLDAVIETAEGSLHSALPYGRSYVDEVLPDADDSTATVQLRYREKITDAITTSTAESLNTTTGIANFSVESRLFRARVNLPGDSWSYARGVYYNSTDAGEL